MNFVAIRAILIVRVLETLDISRHIILVINTYLYKIMTYQFL
jgi:hypothetical protein